ncbi:MAG: NADH-quinone oxidoreductase subunit J [Planctomycetota bacterium]
MMEWLKAHPTSLAGLALWAVGLIWLMPGKELTKARPKIPGLLLSASGIVMFLLSLGRVSTELSDAIMFWVFAVNALICGVLMITARNPVYAALWFALTTLATCGLFLLQSAPFLAAATVIVYAGAVIVTFLFVIMLAQQSGAANYDQKAVQPILAIASAFVLLGAVTWTLQSKSIEFDADSAPKVATANGPATPGNSFSKADKDHAVGNLKGLGRSLFSDYLFAVELAGTLLLVACIGAIAIAPRRETGAL